MRAPTASSSGMPQSTTARRRAASWVIVEGGIARLLEGGSIAGSTLTQDAALRRAVVDCGIPLDEAVGALTVAPAAAIGRAHDLGRLDPGYAADAVLLTPDLDVEAVWGAGARLA